MKISISASAYEDLQGIKIYYQNEGVPQVGENFVKAIIKHIETLAENPMIGRMVPEFEEEEIRELIRPPFRVVYLYEKNRVHIIRVWRSERLLIIPESKV
mgnify:CR=1 FL=1